MVKLAGTEDNESNLYDMAQSLNSAKGTFENQDLVKLHLNLLNASSEQAKAQVMETVFSKDRGPSPELLAKLLELSGDSNSKIAGLAVRAASKLAATDEDKAAVAEAVSKLTSNENPFTHSAAAIALGEVGGKSEVPVLVKLLDDTTAYEKVKYERKSPRGGSGAYVVNRLTNNMRVDEAAVMALVKVSRTGNGLERLNLDPLPRDASEDQVKTLVDAAKTWAQGVK